MRRDLHRSIVTIRVREEPAQESFVIHKELISYYSVFFRSCTNGHWLESGTGVVNLPDDDVELFKIFVQWLYTQLIVLNDKQKNHYRVIIDLFILVNKLQCSELQNATLDFLYRRFSETNTLYPPTDIYYVWENTTNNSSLRRYLVDLYVYDSQIDHVVESQEHYPSEFMKEVLKGFVKRVPDRLPGEHTPYEMGMGAYHVQD